MTSEMPERLRAYYQKYDAMSLPEKSEHLREDETDASQQWPDFLDFLDEWSTLYKQKLQQTRKDYIYTSLARHGARMACRTHHHVFSHEPHPDADVIITSPDDYVNIDACWWKTLTKHDEALASSDEHATALQLSCPEARAIQQLTAIQMVTQEHLPPAPLTFERFQKEWWSTPTRQKATELLMSSTQPFFLLQKAIANVKTIDVPQTPTWLNVPTQTPDIIKANEEVLSDHGLHTLLRVRSDRHEVFRLISEMRARHNPEGKLDPKRLAQHIQECEHCKTPSALSTTYPAVYYAPPGNGKSTAFDKELFVGVDTDWLIRCSTYREVIHPFISRSIPILTNQYSLVSGSGVRFFGSFNPERLRLNPITNTPYTTLAEIEKSRQVLQADLFIIYTKEYFSDTLPLLIRSAYLYEYTQYLWLHKSIKAKFIRHRFETMTSEGLSRIIDRWKISTRPSGKQRRRRI